MKDRFVIW